MSLCFLNWFLVSSQSFNERPVVVVFMDLVNPPAAGQARKTSPLTILCSTKRQIDITLDCLMSRCIFTQSGDMDVRWRCDSQIWWYWQYLEQNSERPDEGLCLLKTKGWLVGWLEFNGSFSTKRLFSIIMSYNLLYKQISFIYCSTEEGWTLWKSWDISEVR